MTRRHEKPTAGATDGPPAAADGSLVFVDAIEGGQARLLLGVDAFDVPVRLLPAGTREGSWLRLSMQLAPPPPDEGDALRQKLGRDDSGGDIEL